jgi:RNA polymerase sigma-70 factor (ECF subfamily)
MAIAGEVRTAAQADAEHQVLAQAVREHSRFVFKVAYSLLRNAADAEDAVQETFLRAMRHLREFAKVDDQRAWLARTAWRIAVDRARRRTEPSFDEEANAALMAQLSADSAGFRNGDDVSAEALVIGDQMLALLRALIAKLPPDLRDVITLSTVQEMTSAEIAAALGIPEGSVRTRQLRARKLLKEKFTTLLNKREEAHSLSGVHVEGDV